MDNLIIAGILLLIKAMIFYIVNILEVLLEDIGILKSLFLHNAITIISSSVLYFYCPITSSILAFQLPLYLMTVS